MKEPQPLILNTGNRDEAKAVKIAEEKAKLVSKKTGERIRFRWITEENDQVSYFEIKILKDIFKIDKRNLFWL